MLNGCCWPVIGIPTQEALALPVSYPLLFHPLPSLSPPFFSLLEDGVDLSALLEPPKQPPQQQEPQPQEPPPAPSSGQIEATAEEEKEEQPLTSLATPSWRPWRRRRRRRQLRHQAGREDPHVEVVRLCGQATRALVGRACTLLLVYYLPTFILYAWLASYNVRAPAPLRAVASSVLFVCFVVRPVPSPPPFTRVLHAPAHLPPKLHTPHHSSRNRRPPWCRSWAWSSS
jgi:hypothetical protein